MAHAGWMGRGELFRRYLTPMAKIKHCNNTVPQLHGAEDRTHLYERYTKFVFVKKYQQNYTIEREGGACPIVTFSYTCPTTFNHDCSYTRRYYWSTMELFFRSILPQRFTWDPWCTIRIGSTPTFFNLYFDFVSLICLRSTLRLEQTKTVLKQDRYKEFVHWSSEEQE